MIFVKVNLTAVPVVSDFIQTSSRTFFERKTNFLFSEDLFGRLGGAFDVFADEILNLRQK